MTNIPVASPAPSPVARCPTHLGGGTSQTQVQVQAQSTTSGAMDAPPSWPGVMADEIVHEIQLESMVGAPGYVGGLCRFARMSRSVSAPSLTALASGEDAETGIPRVSDRIEEDEAGEDAADDAACLATPPDDCGGSSALPRWNAGEAQSAQQQSQTSARYVELLLRVRRRRRRQQQQQQQQQQPVPQLENQPV